LGDGEVTSVLPRDRCLPDPPGPVGAGGVEDRPDGRRDPPLVPPRPPPPTDPAHPHPPPPPRHPLPPPPPPAPPAATVGGSAPHQPHQIVPGRLLIRPPPSHGRIPSAALVLLQNFLVDAGRLVGDALPGVACPDFPQRLPAQRLRQPVGREQVHHRVGQRC